MKDILDNFTIDTNPPPTFSRLAFICVVLNSGLIGYIIFSMPVMIKASEGVPAPNPLLIISARILIVLGFLLSTISIFRKEDSVYFKWIAVCINFLFMAFFVFMDPNWVKIEG